MLWRIMTRMALAMWIAACGRIGFDAGSDGPDGALAITAPATLLPNTATRLTATAEVAWTVEPAALASIDSTGLLRTKGVGSITVRATAVSDSTAFAEVTIASTNALAPAVLVDVGATAHAAGLGHQQHGLYADELGEWWYWYTSTAAVDRLRSLHSSDFATWTAGAEVALGFNHGSDGRNLALADRVIGGHHVVHLSVGYIDVVRGREHVKAELSSSGCAFGAPRMINAGGNRDPDGPAVAIMGDGHVVDGTGWEGTPQTPPLSPCGDGDISIYTSGAIDDGATSFDTATWNEKVIWCVNNRVNARWFFADDNTLYHLYEDGATDPDPVNVLWNVRDTAGTWSPDESTVKTTPPSVFGNDTTFAYNDWSATVVDRTMHAIRRIAPGTFEHRVMALGTSTWTDGGALAASPAVAGSNIVLLPYGAGVLAAQIASNQNLQYAFYLDGAWSAWNTFDAPGSGRGEIAAIAGSHPALVWTEVTTITGSALP